MAVTDRLFSRLSETLREPAGLHKLVGVVGAFTAGLISVENYVRARVVHDLSSLNSLLSTDVLFVLLPGVLWLLSVIRTNKVTQWLHVLAFGVAYLASATTAEAGSLTPAAFAALTLIFTNEYALGPRAIPVVTTIVLVSFGPATYVGHSQDVADPLVTTIATSIVSLAILFLLGIVFYRYRVQSRDQANSLEQLVQERTEDLQAMVTERDVMVQEVHHRVKNNLQLLISMLNMQERAAQNDRERETISTIRDRIYAMALVHRTLHKGRGLDRLDLSDYVESLVQSIVGTAFHPFRVDFSLPNRFPVTLDTAVSLGIAINELLANAIKHAFPPERDGEAAIQVGAAQQDSQLQIWVEDNGVGCRDLEDREAVGRSARSGLGIANAVIEHLEGELAFQCKAGTRATISIPQ